MYKGAFTLTFGQDIAMVPLRQTPKSLSPSLVHLPGILSLFLIS